MLCPEGQLTAVVSSHMAGQLGPRSAGSWPLTASHTHLQLLMCDLQDHFAATGPRKTAAQIQAQQRDLMSKLPEVWQAKLLLHVSTRIWELLPFTALLAHFYNPFHRLRLTSQAARVICRAPALTAAC